MITPQVPALKGMTPLGISPKPSLPKHSLNELSDILSEARIAAGVAGKIQLEKLQKAGSTFSVHNAPFGKPVEKESVGMMLDVCGMAYCLIPKRQLSKRNPAVRDLINAGKLSDWDYHKCLCVCISTQRQEMSVREEQARAAVAVMQKYGYTGAYVYSRID